MFCRYSIISSLADIKQKFQLFEVNLQPPSVVNPNIGPGDFAPVIFQGDSKNIVMCQFGIPEFGREVIFNIRAEGDRNRDDNPLYKGVRNIVNGKYRQQMLHNRCAIICDAFIVGHDTPNPYLVYPRNKQRPFLLAGIWKEVHDKATGEKFKSFAIITIFGNRLMKMLGQSRAPVILGSRNARYWLKGDNMSLGVSSDLQSFDYNLFNAYPISTAINDQNNKSLGNIKPIGPKLLEEFSEGMQRHVHEMQARREQEKQENYGGDL